MSLDLTQCLLVGVLAFPTLHTIVRLMFMVEPRQRLALQYAHTVAGEWNVRCDAPVRYVDGVAFSTRMTISTKRTIAAVAVGAAMASLPFVFEHLPIRPPIDEYIQPGVGFLMLPGLIFGVILAGGNVHTYSLGIVEVADFFFYGALAYFVVGKLMSRRMKRSAGGFGPSEP